MVSWCVAATLGGRILINDVATLTCYCAVSCIVGYTYLAIYLTSLNRKYWYFFFIVCSLCAFVPLRPFIALCDSLFPVPCDSCAVQFRLTSKNLFQSCELPSLLYNSTMEPRHPVLQMLNPLYYCTPWNQRLYLVRVAIASCHSEALFILSTASEPSKCTGSHTQRSQAELLAPNTNRGVIFIGQRWQRWYRKTVRKISGFCRIVLPPSCREPKVCPRT